MGSFLKTVDFLGRIWYTDVIMMCEVVMVEKVFREVVAALIWDGDRFLICQRPANKGNALLWEFVGGKVEKGETKEEALVRECREELDVQVLVGSPFCDVYHEYPDIKVHLTVFHARLLLGVPKLLEHHDLRWITPREITDFDFCPADADILTRIQNEYKGE